MSLINQMLKDIDKRQGLPSSTFSDDSDFKPSLPQARSASPARLVLWGGIVLAAGAVGYGVYQWRLQEGKPAGAPVAKAAASPEAPVMTAITVEDKARPAAAVAEEGRSEAKKASAPARDSVPVAAADGVKPGTPRAPAAAGVPASAAAAAAPAPAAAPKPAPASPVAPAQAQAPVRQAATTAPSRPVASKGAAVAAAPGLVTREISAEQRADNAYREAVLLSRQGRAAESQRQLRQALSEQPSHQEARLFLAQSLMDEGKSAEAKSLLAEGLSLKPQGPQIYLALAQAQLLSKETDAAVATLERGWPMASDNASYQALMGTALQQQGRHQEAVQHFVQALRQQPDASHWLVGLGVSLQATGNRQGAAEAYQRALDLGLSATLGQFAREKLAQLGR